MKATRPDYFVRLLGPSTEVVRKLPVSGCVVIGSRDADIEIDEPSLSPRHAVLHIGARLAIEDRDSESGTLLEGRRLKPGVRHPLAVGATAALGAVRLWVLRQQDLPGATPQPPSRAPVPAPAEQLPVRDAGAVSLLADRSAAVVIDRSLERVAAADLNLLLLGEHGVGKDLLAEQLHARSPRSNGRFIRVHCGALPEPLLERELFGCACDAPPGAVRDRPGILERASGGTVFLDGVGELPAGLQPRLLAAIDQREVVRVGDLGPRPIDVRFIAATHRDLDVDVQQGGFRHDLYLRLGAVRLYVPPLRERMFELRDVADAFVVSACRAAGIAPAPEITPEAWSLLERYAWPGNVRELKNVIHQAVLLAATGRITPAELPLQLHRASPHEPGQPAAALPTPEPDRNEEPPRVPGESDERDQIVDALLKCAGNQTRTAKMLGISRGTLIARMESYALPRPRKRTAD